MPPVFKEGECVIIEFGMSDPQPGEVVAISADRKSLTVRLEGGVLGPGDTPLRWRAGNEYDVPAGGKVTVQRLM